jgi:1-acyl-sn-glycerol-3-phosphate acyltransferase
MICDGLERVRSASRAVLRSLSLSAEIVRGAAAYRCRKSNTRDVQAGWLHWICRRVLRAFAVQSTFIGSVPKRGLLVANHLSYLDIVLLASLTPCVFVAKSEVKGWPVFGWFARMAGTVFVDRNNRRDTARANEVIRSALREGALVVLFPEGTSSDGSTVLPFKSSLLEAAIGERVPISAAALRYELSDGDAGAEVCYWGAHTLVPHLIKLLSKREVKASIAFSAVTNTWRDRKKLAAQLHSEVSQLHAELSDVSVAVKATGLTAASHRGSGEMVRASSQRFLQEVTS